MEAEFIPYEQALALKDLGFNEPCLGYYVGKDKEVYMSNEILSAPFQFRLESKTTFVAPTFSQAFRWFREKHSIQATIEPTKDQHRFELGFNYWIWNTKTAEEWFTEPKDRPAGDYVFDSYEEAELECLIKLIKIINEKI
jgi:hypothetical protein